MNTHKWRTLLDGSVEVAVNDGPYEVPRLTSDRLIRCFDNTRSRWEKAVAPIAEEFDVPLSWVIAVITCESGGYPGVVSLAGAVGLMQLMPTTANLTKEQLLDPMTNLRAGCKELARLRRSLATPDLPSVASGYNAGFNPKTRAPWPNSQSSPAVQTPWGMRGELSYIDNVVAANNEYILRTKGGASPRDDDDAPMATFEAPPGASAGVAPPPFLPYEPPAPSSQGTAAATAPSTNPVWPPSVATERPSHPAPEPPSAPAPLKTRLRLDAVLVIAGVIFVAYKILDYYRTTDRLEQLAAAELAQAESAPEPAVAPAA